MLIERSAVGVAYACHHLIDGHAGLRQQPARIFLGIREEEQPLTTVRTDIVIILPYVVPLSL